ncbi:MAG: S-layer homology domain-containing protein [Ruminococcaceae bacterium]|jgi:hypothetical protein|nr:S-layer homology domain-containing protein [Oscillospiraceae bacterium]
MKKLLALVLALVMTLGLATVGSNAAFKDEDKIGDDYKEAVAVVSAIEVMLGDEDGFRPTDTLKRSEGAKIVAYLVATNKVAQGLEGSGTKFTDVPASHWAAGMVEYCATNGIIGGVGDNKFDPDGKLTVVAFAKMMLTSLGYDAQIEGYVGGDWATNVMTRAQRAGLMKGLDGVKPTDEITREQTAQMIFNTLKTAIVEYDAKIAVSVNGADVSVGNSNAKPVTNEELGKQTIYNTQVNAQQVNAQGLQGGAYVVEFAEQYYPQLIRSEGEDTFGRPTTIWTFAREELGSWTNKDLLVATWTEAIKGSVVYKAVGGVAYQYYDKQVWEDGWEIESVDVNINNGNVIRYHDENPRWINAAVPAGLLVNYDEINSKGTWLDCSGDGTVLELYVDDRAGNEYVRLVAINTYLGEVLADSNGKTAQLGVYESQWDTQVARKAQTSTSELNKLEGLKQGDMVLVNEVRPYALNAATNTYLFASNKVSVIATEKAPKLEGVYISKYTADTDKHEVLDDDCMESIVADGKEMTVGKFALWQREILHEYYLETLKGFTYNVYTDLYGYVLGIEENTSDSNFVFVVGSDTKASNIANTSYTAKLIYLDGTTEDVTVKLGSRASNLAKAALTGGAGNRGNANVNAWFSFSKDDNGAITLRDIVDPSDTQGARTMQWASVIDGTNTNVSDPEISSRVTTLPIKNTAVGGTSVVYGNDETVYVTVKAGDISGVGTGPNAITEVLGASKGIKNTAINADNTAGLTTAIPGVGNADTFYLFKSSGMIIAAVVVGQDAGVAKNFVYIVKGPYARQYDKRYIDHYEAIVDGKYVDDLVVDTLETGTTDLDSKLVADRLHQVVYDKDGVVIRVANETAEFDTARNMWLQSAGLAERGAKDLKTDDNKKAGYSYTVVFADDVMQDGYTLVINKNHGYNQSYVLVNSNAKFWVRGASGYTEYSGSLSSALAMAREAGNGERRYITEITAVIDSSNGFAKEVIINTAKKANTNATALNNTLATNGFATITNEIIDGNVVVPANATLQIAGTVLIANGNLTVETGAQVIGTTSKAVLEVSGAVVVDGGSIDNLAVLRGSALNMTNGATVGGVQNTVNGWNATIDLVDFAQIKVGCDLRANILKAEELILVGDENTYVGVYAWLDVDSVVFENTKNDATLDLNNIDVEELATIPNLHVEKGTAKILGNNVVVEQKDGKGTTSQPIVGKVTYKVSGSDDKHSVYANKGDTVTIEFNIEIDGNKLESKSELVSDLVKKSGNTFEFKILEEIKEDTQVEFTAASAKNTGNAKDEEVAAPTPVVIVIGVAEEE